jgi:hypothetical protein
MDEAKQRRMEYKRQWISASRSLTKQKGQNIGSKDADDITTEPFINRKQFRIQPELQDETAACNVEDETAASNIEGEDEDVELNGKEDDNVGEGVWDWDMIDDHIPCSSDSENDSDTEESEQTNLRSELATWANEFQVKHTAVDSLVKLLKKCGHPDMPSTARTLLQTAREVPTEMKSGMTYVYLGLVEQLLKTMGKYPQEELEALSEIKLALNIDGIPIFKSSKNSLWPILCAVQNLSPVVVFPVALTFGGTKPTSLDFLVDTIRDLHPLLVNGLKDGDKTYPVTLQCVVLDAPAKAMVKAVKLYSGYYGCDRCNQKGEWNGRLTYQSTDGLELRTDLSFRNQSNHQHHHAISPFCELPIDMIKTFPIDYMHMACLGVMKRKLLWWKRGKPDVRLSSGQVAEISQNLLNLQRFIPKLFARKPRSLEELDRWKATEYRQFLLYTGKLVLKGILPPEQYNHFLTLSVAMCILVSPRLTEQHSQYAHQLLVYYVQKSRELYGSEFLVFNVHSLLHITADAEAFGSVDNCAAFAFENYMQVLKRMVRSPKNPIVQIVKRLQETQNLALSRPPNKEAVSAKKPNNAYLLDSTTCCEVTDKTNDVDGMGNMLYLCRVCRSTHCLISHATLP